MTLADLANTCCRKCGGVMRPGIAVALPDMESCRQAVADQFAALQSHYPAMEARCVETAVLWESPIPRRKP